MNLLKTNAHLSAKRIVGILIVFCSCFLIIGCSQNGTAEKNEVVETNEIDAKTRETIQAVIEKEFNGPDKKYMELWDAATATQTGDMSQEEYDAWMETPEYKAYINYMKDTYSPYFTENAYDIFSRSGAFYYSFSDQEYKITTSDIQINQSENEDTFYNFTFNVTYENDNGETSDYRFDGNAIVPKEGKIGKIQFNDKDGLSQKITE